MKALPEPQQRQHRVVRDCQVSPQIKQTISARRYFALEVLGREASQKLVCPLDLRFPHLQAESYVGALVLHGFISLRSSVVWEILSEHGSATLRLLFCGLVLNHVPMLNEYSVLNAHNISGNPIHWEPEVAESAVYNDEITFSHNDSRFVFECRRSALYQVKQTLATGSDVSAMLNVFRRPESLRCCVVALIEKRVESLEHQCLVFFLEFSSHFCFLQSLTIGGWGRFSLFFSPIPRPQQGNRGSLSDRPKSEVKSSRVSGPPIC